MKKLLAALAPLTFSLGLIVAGATPAHAPNTPPPATTQQTPGTGNNEAGCQEGQTMHTEGDYDLDGDGVKETHVTNDYVCHNGQWVQTGGRSTTIRIGPRTIRHRK